MCSAFQAGDQGFGRGTEDVVVGDLAPPLGLDPPRGKTVMPAPSLEHRPQADDVKERPLPHHPANRRAVVRVEVAVYRDAARLGEGDRLSDLTPLEILLTQRL